MTTLSIINVLPSNKEEVQCFVNDAKDRILSGYENPLKIGAQLKAFEEVIESLRSDKDIRALTLKEAEKEGKSFKQFNASFQIKETGVKYDYSVCDCQEWNELNDHIKALTEKKKEREKFLQAIKGDVYDNNGVKLTPPVKTSTTNVTITLL
jgi:hypothetical protein